ncbi:nuclear transport factor 2 family protein [Streptomyces venezuelae]|uniref:nuclear transport factor 2 family protein n=1 Tax=Streptomyces venezuelae TaxID=54571 RepID=UPI00123C13F9|nr:nuclear transport factor 2 family protein [Streptomyces venezuelae]QES07530.1 nuclear transport factor 2 family protein [Streptomyces venezuelae]
MHTNDDEAAVAEAIERELLLMTPAVRSSRELSERYLDPEFVEVGASGRRWDRPSMLAAMEVMQGAAEDGPTYVPSEMTGTVLAPGIVHLTFETVLDGRRARRSSIWRKTDDPAGWRMYYHQATPAPDP